jgi:hypothetical protein
MKVNYHHKIIIFFLLLFGAGFGKIAAQDSAAAETILGLRYFLPENKVPYIEITTKKKVGRKFEAVKAIPVNVYFGEVTENNLLGKVTTDNNGAARIAIPANFKSTWDSLNEFKFLAESVPAKGEEVLTTDLTIKKAVLEIDTANADGVRTVTAQLKEKLGNEWIAVKDIEMKLGVKRLLSSLSVGDAETYTSDSSGIASAEFKRDSIPGDSKGALVLVARVEDNDVYGNLVVEKAVPWGVVQKAPADFWRRTLWSTGNRAPGWLLCLAISIIIGVWGTIFYLIRQLLIIKKMGKESGNAVKT